MTLDIRGSLKNTKINIHSLVVIDELLSNAIDSYLIRKSEATSIEGLQVTFLVEFFPKQLDESKVDFKIICTDNGAGFGDEQVKAFVTKDTSYKDDLSISGIGKCRGSGRIQFLHYFNKILIDSTYKTDTNTYSRRKLTLDASSAKNVDESSFVNEISDNAQIKTTISLDLIKSEIYNRFFDNLDLREVFSAESLKNHVMINFLQRFVGLKDCLGEFKIDFHTKYKKNSEETCLQPKDLPTITAKQEVIIHYQDEDGREKSDSEIFCISHYKLSKAEYKLKNNLVALCAKSSVVKSITNRYLKTKTLENNDIEVFYHVVLIESKYLDDRVNVQRDDFEMPEDQKQADLFLKNLITFEQLHDSIDEIIYSMLVPPEWDRDKVVQKITEKYGITSDMITESKVRVHYGDTEEKVVKRVLTSYQEQIIKDTSEIFDIKVEIKNTDPTSIEFREKINDLAWKYTSSLKSIDMANLSQIIVRRAAILEILDLAINKNLQIQTSPEIRCDEKIIHNIFFPMGKDSTEIRDHDIWLLNEEYQYFDYISSDMKLSKLSWDENSYIFEDDIDSELEKILNKNYTDNSAKRPDIAIFNKEGSLIIIEFKAPDVSLDDHVGDLMEYAQLLTAKSKGKIKKVYGYLVGSTVNPNRLIGYKRFPSGLGWFNTAEIREHNQGTMLGELYSEILYYGNVVSRAAMRLEVYKKRLNIDFSSTSKNL